MYNSNAVIYSPVDTNRDLLFVNDKTFMRQIMMEVDPDNKKQ